MGEVSIPGLSGVPDIPQRIPSEWKASYTNDGAMPVVEHGSISPVRLSGRNLVSDQISENFARVDRSTIPNLRGQMLSAFSSADRTPYPFAVTVRPDTGSRRHTDFRHHKSACRRRPPSFLSRSFLFSDARTAGAVCTGLLFSSANRSRRTSLCFLRFVRTVRGYNGGMLTPSSFDTAVFAVLTAANTQIFVGRSRRTAAPFPVPAWHTHKHLPRNIAKPSQWRHMAFCVHFKFLLLLINGFHLCNTRKWGRNQPKRKSSGWFIQPELGKIGIHLFHLFR